MRESNVSNKLAIISIFLQFIPAGLCLWKRLVEWNDCVKLLDSIQNGPSAACRVKQTRTNKVK